MAEEFAVIEASDVNNFGGGNLQNYFGIRSNTSAAGFLKVIQYPKNHGETSQLSLNTGQKSNCKLYSLQNGGNSQLSIANDQFLRVMPTF